jgi:zinc transport system substrate-binding protein
VINFILQYCLRGLGIGFLSFATLLLVVLTTPANSKAADKLSVYVVNYPLKYFSERIGGEYVDVTFPAPPDVDPAYWTPDVSTIASYQQADLIVLNGAGYANWIKKVSLPRSKIVDTSKSFRDRYIALEDAVTHSHGPKGEHAHAAVAFTTWLDFKLATFQALAIANAFDRKLPQHRKLFERNFTALKNDLLALDADIRNVVDRNPSLPLLASHPVYDYLARGYGINLKSVHWEPGEIPGTDQWLDLQKKLEMHPAAWMVWEGEPVAESVKQLKSKGIDSLVFEPCANQPQEGDLFTIMKRNIENLKKAYTN